jgi:hypothetical protein
VSQKAEEKKAKRKLFKDRKPIMRICDGFRCLVTIVQHRYFIRANHTITGGNEFSQNFGPAKQKWAGF